jgi:hypothetical protein
MLYVASEIVHTSTPDTISFRSISAPKAAQQTM